MSKSKPFAREYGYALVTVAASLLMLLGVAAYVVDLSAIRLDRAADQRITDTAASAGALATFEESAVEGCEDALDYVAINTDGISSLSGDCMGTFNSACSPGTARDLTVHSGRWDVTVVNPVPDGHAFMNPGQIGASSYVSSESGDPCERFGVAMTATHSANFSQVIGSTDGSTSVHSVANVVLPDQEPPINLLVLDRFGCDAIHVEGQGGVTVDAIEDPVTLDQYEGLAAADSDASSGCTDGVLHAQGNALIRADGPPGCADEVTAGTGEGCGLIQTLAPGTPGCNAPACQINGSNAEIIPDPSALAERLTRKQIDYEYNCYADYTSPPPGTLWATDPLTVGNEQDIPGCDKGTPAHIYNLTSGVGDIGRAGHRAWSADLGHPCTVDSSNTGITVTDDVWVDCADFVIESDDGVTINGNVIFQGNVHVKSDGLLAIHNAPGWAVFREGVFKKDGQASLDIQGTAVYLSKHSRTDIAGGDKGTLTWIAPSGGDFDDLALWSDSADTHFWAGQGHLEMEGVFFTPLATADYAGSSGQNQTDAQWVADKLHAHGQGKLSIKPLFQFPLKRNDTVRTTLIR